MGWGPRIVMVKVLDWKFVVSEFDLQSHYYVNFQMNTFGKGMHPLILQCMDLILPQFSF